MANQEHLDVLKQGVAVWNRWREENPYTRPNLNHTVFNGSLEFDMSNINFSKTYLDFCNMTHHEFRDANLSETQLMGTFLMGADLRGAVLTGAELNVTNFSGSELAEADFSYAVLVQPIFANVDMQRVKGLESVTHGSPSAIDIQTIYRSGGNIPEVFLRGAGVPESFIQYARSLVNRPIEYYTCFISYSSRDAAFSTRLHADLQQQGVRCWFASEDLKIGDKFWHRIDESIRIYDKLLVVLSGHSVQSDWVEREVMAALEKEKRGKIVLFPITLDDAVKDCTAPWAADIRRSRHIGDFRVLKDHDDYQKAFERLLRDLKASA